MARSVNGDPRTFCEKLSRKSMLKGNLDTELSRKAMRKLRETNEHLGPIGAGIIFEGLHGEKGGVKGALHMRGS